MSKLQIQEQYKEKIASADTIFEKQMIEAEMKHKIRMIEEGIDAKAQRDASQYECIGCGS
jgi:hypothetical protein